MSSGLDLLGAEYIPVLHNGNKWKTGGTLLGGLLGGLLWKDHRVLGTLGGLALGNNIARVARKEIPVRRGIEHMGSHLVAIAASLALPKHPAIGYLAGALGSSLIVDMVDPEKMGEKRTRMGAFGLGVPKLSIDPNIAAPSSASMTPAELAALDRALTPAEQARVDAWQSGQSEAMQAAEEAKPFVDPRTGKLTVSRFTYEPGGAEPLWKRLPWWAWLAIAVVVVGGGGAAAYALMPKKVAT